LWYKSRPVWDFSIPAFIDANQNYMAGFFDT